jgi:hypothetical protein
VDQIVLQGSADQIGNLLDSSNNNLSTILGALVVFAKP